MSRVLDDRLKLIAARLNLPEQEVIMRLVLIGLDTSEDLALTEPQPKGIAP